MRCQRELQRGVLVDAHVHFHDCFELNSFLNSAVLNFRACAERLGVDSGVPGCLAFTESEGISYFRQIREAGFRSSATWSLSPTEEDDSYVLCGHGARVILIAGRQIVTREGLEVLALGFGGNLPDKSTLSDTLDAVASVGALPVLPWGFGKWWFRRGRLVSRVLDSSDPGTVFLGDNGGRVIGGPRPRHFEAAASKGILILPGSDPLPFPSQVTRPGSYGFYLEEEVDLRTPCRSLKEILRRRTRQPVAYGAGESIVGFCRAQVGMQLRKRLRGR